MPRFVNVTVNVEEIVAYASRVSTVAPLAVKAVGGAVEDAANSVRDKAQDNAPVLEGDLKRSIRAEVSGLSARVGTDLRYAAYVEFGTAQHGGPQPYLIPAAEAEAPRYELRVEQAIFDALAAAL